MTRFYPVRYSIYIHKRTVMTYGHITAQIYNELTSTDLKLVTA